MANAHSFPVTGPGMGAGAGEGGQSARSHNNIGHSARICREVAQFDRGDFVNLHLGTQ